MRYLDTDIGERHCKKNMYYRREIDFASYCGNSVILFHAGLPFFSGGFVGVDIFVISRWHYHGFISRLEIGRIQF